MVHGSKFGTIFVLSLRNNQSIFLQDGVDLSTINMSVTFLDVSQTVPDFPETFWTTQYGSVELPTCSLVLNFQRRTPQLTSNPQPIILKPIVGSVVERIQVRRQARGHTVLNCTASFENVLSRPEQTKSNSVCSKTKVHNGERWQIML